MKKILTMVLLTLTLQGCFFAVGAAAGAAAIAAVYDHRTLATKMDDQKIANAIFMKFRSVPALHEESHIEVSCLNRIVLLVGETPNPAWREQAENIARSVPGVDKVYNQITIQGPTSSLTKTSDSWITTKIKTLMLANADLKSGSIKIITENGVVFLLGRVTHQQADIAVDISRQVSGVQKVVKVFQYKD